LRPIEAGDCYYLQDREKLERINQQQDDNHEELKAMVEEISVKQDMLDSKLERFEHKLENGFAERLVNKMQESTNATFNRLFTLIEKQNHIDYQVLLKLIGKGGIIAGIITAVITILTKIL